MEEAEALAALIKAKYLQPEFLAKVNNLRVKSWSIFTNCS